MLDELASKCTFPTSGAVTCAVSGGADSVSLLVLARHCDLDVTAVHVDHGLRADSAGDADTVGVVASAVGAGFRSVAVDVGDGPNLEARARRARYEVLPGDVLTGHTADDQAETVLLQLMRGGGLDGSAGMRMSQRPLLGLRRRDTVALCQFMGINFVDDPSNRDPRHLRNRVRHDLIPLMNEIASRDVVPLLSRAAGMARIDVEYLNSAATEIEVTDVAAVRDAPEALARRAFRLWLGDENPPDAATIDRVMDVVNGRHKRTEVGRGRSVSRSRGTLFLESET